MNWSTLSCEQIYIRVRVAVRVRVAIEVKNVIDVAVPLPNPETFRSVIPPWVKKSE